MFCGQFYPLIGGAERQAEKLSRGLLEKGVHVEVLTPQHEESWQLREEVEGLIINRFPYKNLRNKLPWLRGIGFANTLYINFQTRKAVEKHVLNFDLLHAHIATPMVVAAMEAAHLKGKKALCKIASGGQYFDFEQVNKTSLLGSFIVKRLISSMDQWIAISDEVKKNLIASGVCEGRIKSIPNGVDIPESNNKQKNGKTTNFLYLGRFSKSHPRRDFHTLLYAFDKLVMLFPHCQLKLVGGGDRMEEIKGIISELEYAKNNVQMLGYSDSKIWLEWADVLIQPSYYEGMSNTLLEAMATGLACIANDIPPNRAVLDNGNAGMLVPVEDKNALLSSMTRLVTTDGLSVDYGKRALSRAINVYSMASVAEQYIQLYSDLK